MAEKYLKLSEYKGTRNEFSYPSDNVDPSLKKQKTFHLQVCNAMVADYASNYCYVPFEFGQKRSFEELRAYLTGQQSSQKLKQSILGKSKMNADGTFRTQMNISWDTYYVLPKMYDIMRERNMKSEYDVEATSIDEGSLASKEAEKAIMKFLINPQTKAFMSSVDYRPKQYDPSVIGAQTEEDIDFHFETGGYTTEREIACIAACQKTKMVSRYKVLQDGTFDDLIAAGLAGWKTYIEKSTKLPKIRKVFIDRAIIPYSDHNDFNDISRAAEIRVMTIADIWKENPNLTADELLYLAKCFQWYNQGFNYTASLARFNSLNRFTAPNSIDIDPISRVRILVLDAQWLSVDTEVAMRNTRSDGSVFYKDLPYTFKQDDKSKKNGDEVIKKNVIRKYYSMWVIGTEMMLDYGVCSDVVYYGQDGNKAPRLDYFFVKTGNASLAERCVALVDDINLAIIKQRNTLSTVPAAPGMAVQKDLIENVFLNGIMQQPEDIIQGLIEKGVLYFNGLDDHGKPLYMAGGAKPIDFLDVTKIVGTLQVYGNIIAEKVNEMREVLGIPLGADGSTPNPYDGLGKTQLSLQASNAALYPTFNSFNYLFEAAFDDIVKKWQIVAKDTGAKVGFSPLGVKNLKVLELGKDFSNAEFNIQIRIGLSDDQKAQLMQSIAAQKALGDQTNGASGLNAAEYMYVYEKVISGNYREAMYVMAKIQQKKQIIAQQQKQKDYENNAQLQQQSAQAKAEADQQNIVTKGQIDGKNDALMEILKGYMQQNTMIMQEFLKGRNETMQPVSAEQAEALIANNKNEIAMLTQQPVDTMPQQEEMQPENEQMMQ